MNTGYELTDEGPTDPPATFDYSGFLTIMLSHGHNYLRMWRWELTTTRTNTTASYASPHPWPRTGPGSALDGKPKFDLSRFDPHYFDRMRSRLIEAATRGIYVSVMLFEGWALHRSAAPWRWDGHPMNVSNNINGIDGDVNGDGVGTEVHMLQPEASPITQTQKAYIRKVVDTVNDLDNVLFEIANEPAATSKEWQYSMIRYIKSYEATKAKQHPVGMSSYHYASGTSFINTDLLESPADWIAPYRTGGSRGDYLLDPPAATGKKVVIADTDHISAGGPHMKDAAQVWKNFLRGNNTSVLVGHPDHRTDSTWGPLLKAAGHTNAYAKKMSLARMTPQGALSTTGYALADTGSEYLVYQPKTGTFAVALAAGSYGFEWFDPAAGIVAGSGSFTVSAGPRSFTPPFRGNAVLYLRSSTRSAKLTVSSRQRCE